MEVVGVVSPVYFRVTLLARWFSRHFLRGRGMGFFHRTMLRFIDEDTTLVTLRMNRDSTFCFPASDSYWGHYLLEGRVYEPEIEVLLREIRDLAWGFVDGGANFGYWSVLVSSETYGSHECLAVEMSTSNAELLERNRSLNGDRFAVIRAAIAGGSGETVVFSEHGMHSARSVCLDASADPAAGARVETVGLDELLESFADGHPVIVKLDIEGMEERAILGSNDLTRRRNLVLCFESHHSDHDSKAVQACLARGMEIVCLTEPGRAIPVRDLESARRLKTQPGRGYNFLAFMPGGDTEILRRIRRTAGNLGSGG